MNFHPQERLSHQNRRKATDADLAVLEHHNRTLESLMTHVQACLARRPSAAESAAARKRERRAMAKLIS